MPPTLLGPAGIAALISGRGRVAIVNRTAPDDGVTILALAIARHLPNGEVVPDAAFGLAIGANESVSVEPQSPLADEPDAIEVMLRLRVGDLGAVVDAYAVAHKPAGASGVHFEVGVKPTIGTLIEGESTLPDFAEFTIYGLPAE